MLAGNMKFVCLFGLLLVDVYTAASDQECHQPRVKNPARRKCSNECDTDKDCLSEKKRCLCDGECGPSCVNPDQRCYPKPTHIPHGSVSVSPYNKFGSIATYECQEGYRLVGRTARICQGDGTWKGHAPHCEVVHGILTDAHVQECGHPPPAHHATSDAARGQTKFKLGTNLRYTCDEGYTQHKDSVDMAWCVGGGVWVGPDMICTTSTCNAPPDIPNGFLTILSQITPGGRIRYTCREGHFLIGDEERTCQKDGTWSGAEPSCEQVVCGPPPIVEHAEHSAPKGKYRFPSGTQLTYTCLFGYYRQGTQRAICSGVEGSWKGPEMSCRARDCGAPGEINNGWRDQGYRFTYPTRVTYHCNEGYELRGRPYRECQANGEWSGVLPECEPIHCTELGPPVHGTMIGSETSYGSLIRFVCNDSFKVIGSAERTCQADQTWSGQDAFCEEINCGLPGPLWNGYLDGHRTTVGAVYFYRCNIRTKFNGTSFSTQCLQNGQWSSPIPFCLGQCQVPSITNGTMHNGIEGVWVDHGTVVKPGCLHGRVLNDSRPVTCLNGTWSIIPQCVPAPCNSSPPQIENGHRVFFSLAHQSRARFFCIAGFKLADSHQYMTCEYGKWDGTTPKCVENYCPNPGTLAHGKIHKIGNVGKFPFSDYITIIKHGDRLVYSCARNFRLEGPGGAACVNGVWSPNKKPVCKRSRHPFFSKLWRPYEERNRPAFLYYK